jgi:hypothetical protein
MSPRGTERKDDAVAEKIAVRVTQEPGVVRNVTPEEFTDLERQGLLYAHEQVEGRKSPNRWRGPADAGDVVEAAAPMTATTTDTKEK